MDSPVHWLDLAATALVVVLAVGYGGTFLWIVAALIAVFSAGGLAVISWSINRARSSPR